ncbi:hypothetical protein PC9H_011515 [Pleurotus ostreatus]|uniref:F-box domain-containing protein n=1 Tax=Pleurotus ostreatus TaxID=5322 RepID=A0A8H6ZQQ7_PLEOS|nr:uncharacterized protein PC9H_011515 [Pleurotus ostreatus]KAF7420996.1 hypothetical protein PC9H_011515 [Pleurotus ostreatus]
MSSPLERVPRDLLQYIARLTVSASPFESLTNLLHLLLTNSTIYHQLSVQHSPHLYARVFQLRFDTVAPRRRLHASLLTDSSLAGELILRCRLLRRIRRRDLTGLDIEQDMWTLYWLILENETLNGAHLMRAGSSEYLLELIRHRLRQGSTEEQFMDISHEALSLALWSYCLSVSSRDIADLTPEVVQELLALIRPVAMSTHKDFALNPSPNPFHLPKSRSPPAREQQPCSIFPCNRPDCSNDIFHYSRKWHLRCPDVLSAAIIMTFALKEIVPLQVPPHLPLDRASAIAQNRAGPTMVDYRALATCRTPLFNDPIAEPSPQPNSSAMCLNLPRSTRLEEDFSRMALVSPNALIYGASYTPGMLSGLWEGTFMICPIRSIGANTSNSPFTEDFVGRKPMYCQMTEYMCSGQHVPIPTESHEPFNWDYHPNRLLPIKGGFQVSSKIFHYEKLDATTTRLLARREMNYDVKDILVLGETPDVQEEAWGGYRFAGKVRLSDGFITLKRVSKDILDDPPWLFEGYLHYGAAFVGTWRTHEQHVRNASAWADGFIHDG